MSEKKEKSKVRQGFKKLWNDLKPMTFKQKCEHLWTYYKEWLFVVFLVVMGISLMVTVLGHQQKDFVITGMMVNVPMDQRGMNYLSNDYKVHLGATKKNQVAELTYTSFGDPFDPENGEESEYASMILPARVTGELLDYMILDKYAMVYYIDHDVYMDLRQVFTEEELAELDAQGRVFYGVPEGGEQWPVAIKITDTPFIKDNVLTNEDIYFALAGSSPRPEKCRDMWEYINAWKSE